MGCMCACMNVSMWVCKHTHRCLYTRACVRACVGSCAIVVLKMSMGIGGCEKECMGRKDSAVKKKELEGEKKRGWKQVEEVKDTIRCF